MIDSSVILLRYVKEVSTKREMWNSNCTVKGCGRLAAYAEPSKQAEVCKSHASQGMIEQNYVCCNAANCVKVALFGDSQQLLHCDDHRQDGDVYHVLRVCQTCSALYSKQSKQEPQCQECQDGFIKTIDSFIKERLPTSLKGSGKQLTYQYTPPEAQNDIKLPLIILEFSRGVPKSEKPDNGTYATLQQVVKRPVIVVRVNMGRFKQATKSKVPTPSHNDRLNTLYHFIQQAATPIEMPLLIKYMFHDGYSLDSSAE